MRIVSVAPFSAKAVSVRIARRPSSPGAIVCAALMLALILLAFQIGRVLDSGLFSDCSFIGDSVTAGCSIP